MHAVEDLIHAKGCLHFKDCYDKISLDNMPLDLDAFDGWQNTRQESDHSVPPVAAKGWLESRRARVDTILR